MLDDPASTRLETPRLVLRRFVDTDIDDYYEIMRQPLVGRWLRGLDDGMGFTMEQTRSWIEMFNSVWEESGYGPFAVILKEGGALIGHCGLRYNSNFEWTEAMYGLHPDHWGKGYITEACRACLDWGFSELGLEKVYDYTLPDNLGSRRIKEKLGFVFVKNFDYKGFDHVLYVLNKNELVHP